MVILAMLLCQSPVSDYARFAEEVQRPSFDRVDSVQFDRLDIVPDGIYAGRWIKNHDGAAGRSSPSDSITREEFENPIPESAFVSVNLSNEDYWADVIIKDIKNPILSEVAPFTAATNSPGGGLQAYTEYFTRLRLDDLVDHPYITIQEFGDDPGSSLKRLTILVQREGDKTPHEQTLLLDPELGHCVESTIFHEGEPVRKTKIQMSQLPGGIPFQVQTETTIPPVPERNRPATKETVLIRRVVVLDKLDPAQFRLSHYGLPEPTFVKAKGWPVWPWLLVVGLGLVLGAKLLTRRK